MSEANLFVDYTGAYADDDSEGLDGDKSGEPSVLLVGKQISVCLPGTKLTPHETQPYLYTLSREPGAACEKRECNLCAILPTRMTTFKFLNLNQVVATSSR